MYCRRFRKKASEREFRAGDRLRAKGDAALVGNGESRKERKRREKKGEETELVEAERVSYSSESEMEDERKRKQEAEAQGMVWRRRDSFQRKVRKLQKSFVGKEPQKEEEFDFELAKKIQNYERMFGQDAKHRTYLDKLRLM